MDVRINQLNSTVRAVDADSLLTPEVVERIARAVVDKLATHRADADARARDAGIGARRVAPDRLG